MLDVLTKQEKRIIGFTISGFILYLVLALSFPLISLWAINTLLFPVFSIPYSFSSYLAMLIVNWILMGSHVVQYRKIIDKI